MRWNIIVLSILLIIDSWSGEGIIRRAIAVVLSFSIVIATLLSIYTIAELSDADAHHPTVSNGELNLNNWNLEEKGTDN